jgi:hypothetical protein
MSPRANALLDAARGEMSLDAERAARMRARLLAATGGAAVVGAVGATIASHASTAATTAAATTAAATPAAAATTTAAPAAATVASHVSMSLGAKIVLCVLGAAAVATGMHMIDRVILRAAPPAPPTVITTTRVVLAPAPVATPVPGVQAPAPLIVRIEAAPARARLAPPPPSAPSEGAPARVVSADDRALVDLAPPSFDQGADALARELSQVRGAEAALREGDGAGALVALDAHDRDFPAGQLAEEAGVLRIEALCAVGRTIDAAGARASFLSRWPRSAQRARAERACGGDGSR